MLSLNTDDTHPDGKYATEPIIAPLNVAHKLADLGVPIFRASGDGMPGGFRFPAEWQRWKPGDASHAAVDAWRPGDALCAVMGHVLDGIDVDPRNGGDGDQLRRFRDAGLMPEIWAVAATPSGGLHFYVKAIGERKSDPIRGYAGIDYQGGSPEGDGRGILFIPPTVRPSKVDGTPHAYAWCGRMELPNPHAFGWIADESGYPLRDYLRRQGRHSGTAGNSDFGKGGYDNALTALGGKMRELGWWPDQESLSRSLHAIAGSMADPLPAERVEKIARSVDRYESGTLVTDEDLAWAQTLAGESDPGLANLIHAEYRREKSRRAAVCRLDEEEIAAARGPRPKRTVAEYALLPQPAAIISGALAAEVNLLGGPSEAGKSLLARDWALTVAAGGIWRGHGVPEPRNCLYIASEGLHDVAERWRGQPLWESAKERVFVLDEPVSLLSADDVSWLLTEYSGEKPGLVIYDVIYAMGLADDNGTKDVAPAIAAMKRISAEWGAATLAIGHPGHNGERRFRGSSMWRQLAATEWHMADGSLTCEKSKIADKRRLGAPYVADYPHLRYLTTPEALGREAARQQMMDADMAAHPEDSARMRARRLHAVLGFMTEGSARNWIDQYVKYSEVNAQ